jgi:hypothetical protein
MMLAPLTTGGPAPGAVLEDLLASRFLSRRWARRVGSYRDLPPCLERCARGLAVDLEWRAYLDDDRLLFAVARLNCAPRRRDPETALDVYFMDENASIYSAGVWEYDALHGWWLDAVLDLSYDCERGWWLDGLMEPQRVPDRRRLPHHR